MNATLPFADAQRHATTAPRQGAIAFLMLTAARDRAVASMRLKHVDLVQGCVYQDARDVKTKFAKTFITWFFPVDDACLQNINAWVNYLRQDELFGPSDALFPKPRIGLKDGALAAPGLSRDTYSNAGRLRPVIKDAFTSVGLRFGKAGGRVRGHHRRSAACFDQRAGCPRRDFVSQ